MQKATGTNQNTKRNDERRMDYMSFEKIYDKSETTLRHLITRYEKTKKTDLQVFRRMA